MSHLSPGLISAYNSLTDKHLAGYFSSTRIRRHLQRAGLISRSGRIVPDKEYRHRLFQRSHQRHVRECLAQAIFHKVLEMERLHQIEIKRKLEEFARRERVHKIKVDRSRRYEEDIIRIMSPRPPTGVRGSRRQHTGPEGAHSESSESLGSSRPNTAPGKMQRPARLKPIHSNGATAPLRRSSPYRLLESSNENEQPLNSTMDKSRRRLTTTATETCNGISPYCLPVINNFVTPVPPATKRKERGVRVTPSATLRGRRLRPTTATSGAADVSEDPAVVLRSSVHQSRVFVNMVFFGKTVHLSHDLIDMRDEVKVFQQHCGGENLCVYKGKLREGETFQFISRRHRGFPFSLTFFLNGLQVERLSSCCEFKHRKGPRLGGRHGHFGFCSVEGASPCYKCIIAMGLDKKPTPPPKRGKDDGGGGEASVTSPTDAPEMETGQTGEDVVSHSDCKSSQRQDTKTRVKDPTVTEEDKVRDDYEEDFEADDEGPAEETKGNRSPSPSSETETQVKERETSETEDDEKDDNIMSRSGSSCSGSDREASDAEATKDSREDERAEQPEEVEHEEAVAPSREEDEPRPREAAAAADEAECGAAKDHDLPDSAGDSTEMDMTDTGVPSGHKQSDGTSGEKEAEETVCAGQRGEEEQEQERAKSVQEKLAEAILKESQRSSEPELSDTSTEEDEDATDKGHGQSDNDVVREQQQTSVEETKCEESVGEVVQDQEETSEPKQQEEETEKVSHENSDSLKDEINENDEKPASEEEEKSEDIGASLHPETEENTTSEPLDDAAAEDSDPAVTPNDVENEEKSSEVEEADSRPDETERGAKSREADESSVSEPDEKPDETALSDNAEAMTASATMEMKAEPPEEREALGCEEAPVTDADATAASQPEVAAENSSSSLEGSVDTAVEKTADVSEDNAKDEGSEDDVREEEAEEASAGETSNQPEGVGEEKKENSVEMNDESERETSAEKSKEGENLTDLEETPEEETSDEKENNETKKEEEGKDESKREEVIENEENIVEDTKTESIAARQTNEEPADEVAHEEEVAKDEHSESVEEKNDEKESEAKEATTGKTNEDEEIKEADEEKGEGAEEGGNKDEQRESEKNKDEEESEEINIIASTTKEAEEESEVTEESEKMAEGEKTSNKDPIDSEDVGDAAAADETKTAEEMLDGVVESEGAERDAEGTSSDGKMREIDAENGEISTGAETGSRDFDDEAAASTEGKNDAKTTEEGATEGDGTEVKEEEEESGDDAGKHDGDNVDRSPETDVAECADDGGDKPDESAPQETEEIVETEIEVQRTEESTADDLNTSREDGEERKRDENANKPDLNNENPGSDSRNNDDIVDEAITTSSPDRAQSSTATDFGLGGMTQKPDESTATSDDIAAADTEEASKASEEGGSVLLKPSVAEEGVAQVKGTPEALATEDNSDLVTNWVTVHQMSKCFETFVEPLEDLKQEAPQTGVSRSSEEEEEAKSSELPRLGSPLQAAKMSEHEQVQKDESGKKAAENGHSEDKPPEDDAARGALREEETEVEDFVLQTNTEVNDDEESARGRRRGSKGSVGEDNVKGGQTQSDISKTEMESVAGARLSVASVKPESVTEKPSEEKTPGDRPDSSGKQTASEETENRSPPSKTGARDERPASPGGRREATEITYFTTSEDGSQAESRGGGIRPRPPAGSGVGERRDSQLIQDIKHTLSRERLSSFSLDHETTFGRGSYPLLTAARTES